VPPTLRWPPHLPASTNSSCRWPMWCRTP
jgi:hypothetical protein